MMCKWKHALRHVSVVGMDLQKCSVCIKPCFPYRNFHHSKWSADAKQDIRTYSWTTRGDLPSRSPSWMTEWDWSWWATRLGCSLLSVLAFRSHTSAADSYKKKKKKRDSIRLAFGPSISVGVSPHSGSILTQVATSICSMCSHSGYNCSLYEDKARLEQLKCC